jgi:hypothetical protein
MSVDLAQPYEMGEDEVGGRNLSESMKNPYG